LIRPDLDVWDPGEHNGTFRGINPSFVTATAALDYWTDDGLTRDVLTKGDLVERTLLGVAGSFASEGAETRGRGLIQGVAFDDAGIAGRVCQRAFDRGLLIETSGPDSEVVKLMPPLTIEPDELDDGLRLFSEAVDDVLVVAGSPGTRR
jgi:diaminobutyrate-2-oxoglutarate transaminase